jgi:hypothetical protein
VAASHWAIEFEQPAADAFALNNPDAAVFATDCNAILLVSCCCCCCRCCSVGMCDAANAIASMLRQLLGCLIQCHKVLIAYALDPAGMLHPHGLCMPAPV